MLGKFNNILKDKEASVFYNLSLNWKRFRYLLKPGNGCKHLAKYYDDDMCSFSHQLLDSLYPIGQFRILTLGLDLA